jgi:predicted transcriptional regulator
MQRKCDTLREMKTSTIPSVRVEPELRKQLEKVLQAGETLSSFVETSVRETVRRRMEQAEFVKRGVASLELARRSGEYVEAEAVVAKLQARLDRAKSKPRRPTAAKR